MPDVTKRAGNTGDAAGHGCGHNHMLGAGAVTGAIMIKRFLEQEGNIRGPLRFYGCPEEELLSGKVKMAYYHMFDGCDTAADMAPDASANMVHDQGYLASASATVLFQRKNFYMQHLHRKEGGVRFGRCGTDECRQPTT